MNDPITNASTTNEPRQDSGQPLYISPVLAQLEQKHRPNPSPACETCPASVWFITSRLKCFCSQMHLIVWEDAEPPIMQCDGRELALLKLALDQE